MGKRRLRIMFKRQNGSTSEFWVAQPAGWADMSAEAREAWVSRTAFRRHRGAQSAKVIQET